MDYEKTGTCSICGKTYEHWGNNAWPINEGRCCDKCNLDYVVPARIGLHVELPKKAKAK